MSVLTGSAIIAAVERGDITITPFNRERVNPNSYNLTLSDKLKVYDLNQADSPYIDLKKETPTKEIVIPPEGLVLRPGVLYLGAINEHTFTDRYRPTLDGRSSIGRSGVAIHVTAGYGDVNFSGVWTLEIWCVQPVKIYPNIEICQISYNTLEGDTSIRYNGKYQNSTGVIASRIFQDRSLLHADEITEMEAAKTWFTQAGPTESDVNYMIAHGVITEEKILELYRTMKAEQNS